MNQQPGITDTGRKSRKKPDRKRIEVWGYRNAAAIVLVIVFGVIFIASRSVEDSFFYFGTTGIQYLNGEYYRFITCLFLHYNLRHLLANSAALLSVSSLLAPFLGRGKTVFLFLSGGILSEIAYSVVITEQIYDIGASSGVFTLIACLLVCFLRFPNQFRMAWYRLDVMIVVVYFIFANTSISAFLVHTFGFAAGILIGFIMVSVGWGKAPDRHEE
ncbi:MAG: rhomboid family intramembrane serine protease [Clostridiales bacterium]|nr:rhomboid family intramembrane serine protease [Clostridiales bacterium]